MSVGADGGGAPTHSPPQRGSGAAPDGGAEVPDGGADVGARGGEASPMPSRRPNSPEDPATPSSASPGKPTKASAPPSAPTSPSRSVSERPSQRPSRPQCDQHSFAHEVVPRALVVPADRRALVVGARGDRVGAGQ